MISVSVQTGEFDPGREQAALEASGGGAVATFTGLVRGDDGLVELHLDHYPAMTQNQLEVLAAEASERWSLLGVRLIHRVGPLGPGERIVFVATAARHRQAALESCAFLIDWLKTSAPFWKRERYADGRINWVEAREEDDERAARWRDREG